MQIYLVLSYDNKKGARRFVESETCCAIEHVDAKMSVHTTRTNGSFVPTFRQSHAALDEM